MIAGNTATANEANGILAAPRCQNIVGNASAFNAGWQLFMSSSTGWADNVLRTEPTIPGSTLFSSGVQIGPNLCDGALCP